MSLYDRVFSEAIGSRNLETAIDTAAEAYKTGKSVTFHVHKTDPNAKVHVQVHGGSRDSMFTNPGKDYMPLAFGTHTFKAKGRVGQTLNHDAAERITRGMRERLYGYDRKSGPNDLVKSAGPGTLTARKAAKAKQATITRMPTQAAATGTRSARGMVASSLGSIANFYESVVQAPLSFQPGEEPRYRNAGRSAATLGLRHTGKDKKVVTRAIQKLRDTKAGK